MSEQTLSKRGQGNLPSSDSIEKLIQIFSKGYDKETCPDGIVSLGVAENGLMHKELAEYLNKLEISPYHLTYGNGPFGSQALRSALSSYFNDYFKPATPVLPGHLLVAGGVTSTIDLTTYGVANDGDGILIGRPLYTSFAGDIRARAGAKLCAVSSEGRDPMGDEMVEQYEKELLKQEKEGTRIRAIILSSPHNPLGKCYSVETLKAYMRLCQKYRTHLISDEVYAMSIYRTPHNTTATPFTSVLSIPTADLIDPDLVHVLYGMSKDFACNGLRCGVLLSQSNAALLRALKSVAVFSWPTSVTEYYWTTLLNDRAFLDYYLAENSKRLAAGYARLTGFFEENGIKWIEGSNAGFFVWADFRGLLGPDVVVNVDGMGNEEEEQVVEEVAVARPSQVYWTSRKAAERDDWFFEKLLQAKVFVASGNSFFAEEHGWYRVSFSVPSDVLEVGLDRLKVVLEEVSR